MPEPRCGTVFLVGAGPGDPGLITVHGRECLASADVVLYDRLVSPELLDLCRPDAELVDVGKRPGEAGISQAEIEALLIAHAQAGRVVVRLKGGDPFVFGRGAEESAACRAARVGCIVVPGVTSAIAVPAAVGIPVTHRGLARSFAVITGRTEEDQELPAHDYAALARVDTLVLLMGWSHVRATAAALLSAGKPGDTPAAAISRGTTASQQALCATLATLGDAIEQAYLQPPLVVVVGPTAAFADTSRTHLAQADAPPLAGRRIAVTRSASSASDLQRLLRARGAEIVPIPLIRVEYPDASEVDDHLSHLAEFDWLVFSSLHGVEGFYRRLERHGLDSRVLAGCRVAVVGPGTSRALAAHGIVADFVPDLHMAAGLLEGLQRAQALVGTRILYVCGDHALPTLARGAEAAGATIVRAVVYRTLDVNPPRWALDNLRSGVDAVLFCSPSAVRRYHALGLELNGAIIGCIGATTAQAASDFGFSVTVVPEKPGSPALVAALEEYFAGIGAAA